MNNRFSNWLTILITAAVGVLFIVWHNEVNLFQWLVRALGVMLLIPGVYVLFHSISEIQARKTNTNDESKTAITFRRRSAAISLLIVSGATVFIGLWMLLQPSFFASLIAYLFAAILLLYGIYQLIVVAYYSRPAKLSWHFYIIPSLFMAVSLTILLTSLHTLDSVVTLITGILLLASALNAVVQTIIVRTLIQQINAQAETGETASQAESIKQIEENVD